LSARICAAACCATITTCCRRTYFTGRRDNVSHLVDNRRFEAMRHDVTVPLPVEVNEIYNLTCPASPVHYHFDPVQTTKTSVMGAIDMLGWRSG
jgi:UDP-glucuronate decarboxylase